MAHIRGLSQDSITKRAMRDDWGTREELALQTVEAITQLQYITARAAGFDVSPPERVRRPNDPTPELVSIGDIAAFLKE